MFEKCIYFNTNAFARRLNRIWEEAYKTTGLSAPHAYLVRLVYHEPGITQKQAGKQLKLEKSTVTRFVSAMEESGLLLRQSGDNGREVRLKLTVEGKRLARQLDEIGTGLYKKMRKEIGAGQFDSLIKLLRAGVAA